MGITYSEKDRIIHIYNKEIGNQTTAKKHCKQIDPLKNTVKTQFFTAHRIRHSRRNK